MKIVIYLSLIVLFLSGCSGSASNGSKDGKTPTPDSGPSIPGSPDIRLLAKLNVEVLATNVNSGSLQIAATVTDLINDDAIYLHVIANEIEQGLLLVEPKSSMIYPTNKSASINLMFRNNGAAGSIPITVKLVTATGQIVTKSIDVELNK